MFVMEFVPDVNLARQQYNSLYYNEYSMAYIVTNEPLYKAMEYMPKNCNRALTVAGSGDHPLACSLSGAKIVDTFDISYNAGLITKIKVLALQCLADIEYYDLLCDLYTAKDVLNVPNMDKISEGLSVIENDYLRSMKGCCIFFQGNHPRASNFVTFGGMYERLQEIVKQPYNFTMTHIMELSGKLVESYDFIHLSNVFDYIPLIAQFKILEQLSEHVNIGGRIFFSHIVDRPFCRNFFKNTNKFNNVFQNWQDISEKSQDEMSILERVR